MKYMQQIAIILIALVISITINTSIALAGLNINYMGGSDNINNYRRYNDYTKIEVNASIEGDTDITTSQVKIGNCNSATAFTSCSSGVCVFQSSVASVTPKTYTGNIVLCKDDNTQADSKAYSLTVDNTAPTASFNYAAGMVSFSAADTACSACAGCSGIQKVDFVVDGITQKTILGNSLCSYQNTTDLSLNVQGTETKYVCLDVYDNVQNKGTICKDIFIDNSAPSIVDATLIANGVPVTTINGAPIMNAQILVRINEDIGLKDGSVRADLSGLNENSAFKSQYSNIQGSCTKSTYYNCVFPFILQLSNGGSIPIRVEAIDNNSNVMNTTYNINLNVDTTAPQSILIKTNYRDSTGVYWIGPANNTIYADILETGSGFNNKIVTLDMSSILTDAGRYLPTSCTSGWTCMWMLPNSKMETLVTGNSYPLTITYPSQDDAGNQLTGVTSLSVKYDKDIPVKNAIQIMTSADQHGNKFNCLVNECKKGDYVEIKLNVSDSGSNQINAYADLGLIGGDDNSSMSCNYDGANHLCQIDINGLNGPFENTKINFRVYDLTGNVLSFSSDEFSIYGVGNQTEFWNIGSITQRPEVIDRQTTSIIQQRVYYSVNLIGSNANSIIRTYVRDCDSDVSYDDPRIFGNIAGSSTPYLEFVLNQQDFPNNEYNITCKLGILTLYDRKIYTEEKNLTIPVKFYSMPLGYLPAKVTEEIDRVKNSDLVQEKGIMKLNDFFEDWKYGCKILNNVLSIVSVLASIQAIFAGLGDLGIAWAKTIGNYLNIAKITGSKIYIVLAKINEWGCAAVSCKLASKLFDKFVNDKNLPIDDPAKKESATTIIDYLYKNPEESIYSSILTLCVPGVVYNMEKARQIECAYIKCLRDEVPQGMPLYKCTYERKYNMCKFVFSQKRLGIPFAQMWNYLTGALMEMVKNPASVVFVMASIGCSASNNILELPKALCSIYQIFKSISQITDYVNGFEDSWGKVQGDLCDGVLDETTS